MKLSKRIKIVEEIQKLAKELKIDEGTLGLHNSTDDDVKKILVELREIKRINEE